MRQRREIKTEILRSTRHRTQAPGFEAKSPCVLLKLVGLVGLEQWHGGSGAISPLFWFKEELTCKKCKKPYAAGKKKS